MSDSSLTLLRSAVTVSAMPGPDPVVGRLTGDVGERDDRHRVGRGRQLGWARSHGETGRRRVRSRCHPALDILSDRSEVDQQFSGRLVPCIGVLLQ